jgi:Family of unknown function (DUF5946)
MLRTEACRCGVATAAMAKASESVNGPSSDTARCGACGAPLRAFGDCRAVFDELLAREFGDYRYARLHRLTVDTYALQHPEQFMRSAKSFAAHLTGMCAALETEEAAAINRSVQQWLNGVKSLERPLDVPPGKRGTVTVVYAHEAAEPAEYLKRVQEWARSAWAAWASHHDIARRWIALARK